MENIKTLQALQKLEANKNTNFKFDLNSPDFKGLWKDVTTNSPRKNRGKQSQIDSYIKGWYEERNMPMPTVDREPVVDKVKSYFNAGMIEPKDFDQVLSATRGNKDVSAYLQDVSQGEWQESKPQSVEQRVFPEDVAVGDEFDLPSVFDEPVDAASADKVSVEIFEDKTTPKKVQTRRGMRVPKTPLVDSPEEATYSILEKNEAVINGAITIQNKNREAQKLINDSEASKQAAMDLALQRGFPESVVNYWANNPITFSEAGEYTKWSEVLPGGGMVQGAEAMSLIRISEDLANGKPVTQAGIDAFNDYVDKVLEMEIRGRSFGGKFRYYGSTMPAFMIEFALSGGAAKTAQTAAKEATLKAVENKVLAQVAGATSRVAAQTALLMPTQGAKNYGDIELNSEWVITDKGQVHIQGATESPATVALMAFGYTAAEVASELSGLAVASKLAKSTRFQNGKAKVKSSLTTSITKLPEPLKQGLYKAYQKIKPNAKVTDVLSAAGWNGMLLELGEERVADILRETTNLALKDDYTYEEVLSGLVPDAEQLLLEAGLIATVGGVKATADITFNMLVAKGVEKEKAKQMLDELSAAEQEALVQENLTVDLSTVEPIDTGEALTDVELGVIPDAEITRAEEQFDVEVEPVEAVIIDNYKLDSDGILDVDDLTGNLPPIPEGHIRLFKGGSPTATFDDVFIRENLAQYKPPEGTSARYWTDDPSVADFYREAYNINKDATLSYVDIPISQAQAAKADDGYLIETTNAEIISADDSITDLVDAVDEAVQDVASPPEPPVTDSQQAQQDAAKTPPVVAEKESIFRDLYYTWFDDLGAFIDLAQEGIKRGAETTLATATRLYAGVTGMATQALTTETFVMNRNGQLSVTGVGLKPILDGFDAQVIQYETNKAQREKDLTEYLIARRYYYDLTQREDVEVSEEQALGAVETLTRLTEKYGDAIAIFDTTSQDIYAFQDRMLKLLVSAGNMSQEQYDAIKEQNKNYIPFARVLDDTYGEGAGERGLVITEKFGGARIAKAIKRIRGGSDLEIKNPIESIMQNTFRIMDLAWQNKVATEIAKLSEVMPEYVEKLSQVTTKVAEVEIDAETTKSVFRPIKDVFKDSEGKRVSVKDVMEILVDGKVQYYKVHPSIKKAVEGMKPETITGLGWLLSTPASIMRTGATIVPEFIARNFIRDVHGAFVLSEARPGVVDIVKGMTARIGKSELYDEWMKSGGAFNSYMDMSDNGAEKAMKALIKGEGKIDRYLKTPLGIVNVLQDVGTVVEQGVRIGTYNAAKRKGMTDADAALQARDASIDFARGGSATKILNRYIPFLNAGFQGLDKMRRAATTNPKAFIAWGTATITVPSLVITGWYLHFAPEEDKKEYLEIPQWQKDLFWVVKVDGAWVRYPKPFTIGYAFGSLPERFLIWADSEGRTDGKELVVELTKGMASALSPVYDPSGVMPSVFKTYVETVANYDFFRGQRIYPDWMDSLPPEQRKSSYTSDTAVAIGEAIGYSPAKIEKIITGSLATSGKYVLDAGDFLIDSVKKYNDEPIIERPSSITDIPLVRAFTMRHPTGSASQSLPDFYELSTLAKQIKNGYKNASDRREYRKDNYVMFRSMQGIENAMKRIKKENNRIKRIRNHRTMSAQQKEEALLKANNRNLATAQGALERFNKNLINYESKQ